MLFWIVAAAMFLLAVLLTVGLAVHFHIIRTYMPYLVRIFQEKPLFFAPFGQPRKDAEEVILPTTHGVTLHGFYLRTPRPRRGVILFGLEFGSNRWSCLPYCEHLNEHGYDIFAFEMRGQGQSKAQEGYESLQWVTDFELDDFRAALAYLKGRPDRDPRGVGFFGISKGGSAGLLVAAEDPFIRCCVTDGSYGTYTTMIPYERKWLLLYSRRPALCRFVPRWYLLYAAYYGLKLISKSRGCTFPHLEYVLHKIAPRPLLMIHGGADNYIRPEMAQELFAKAGQPKELWIVDGAKHNQALNVANGEYKRRVCAFFDEHLAQGIAEADSIQDQTYPSKEFSTSKRKELALLKTLAGRSLAPLRLCARLLSL